MTQIEARRKLKTQSEHFDRLQAAANLGQLPPEKRRRTLKVILDEA